MSMHSHLDEIDWIGKLADLKQSHYHNTLLLTALIELLTEKEIIKKREFQKKIAELEAECLNIPTQHPIA